jgi:hypothetical protein
MGATSHPTIGCTFASDDAAIAAVRALTLSGLAVDVRLGASDPERASTVARDAGAAAGLESTDPLSGVAGLASGDDASKGVDRGAVIGGAVGAIVGAALANTAVGALVPVDPGSRPFASALMFFAIGIAVGGVLGGAFGRRPSTHAGYRLIDAMEDGAIALVAVIEPARLEETRRALESAGASDFIVIDTLETGAVSPPSE